MARDKSRGRGQFEEHIEIKYAQIPHEVWHMLFVELKDIDEVTRMKAWWCYGNHFFTNDGYASLEAKSPSAYAFCKMADRISYLSQNNARWECFDTLYKGDLTKTYNQAIEEHKKEKKEKKKQSNKEQYEKRKLEAQMPKYLTWEEEQERILKKIEERVKKEDN